MNTSEAQAVPAVIAPLAYLASSEAAPCITVWPPASGRQPERPAMERYDMRIQDCRPLALDLEKDGFLMHLHVTRFRDFLDEARVKAAYFPEMETLLRQLTGAIAVVIFDHNVRSASGAASGQVGVRAPVDMVHDDYTEASGPQRVKDLLEAHGLAHLRGHRAALINVWRPLHGPVVDLPLAVCAAPSVRTEDFVATPIHHYMEDDLQRPSHSGEIYSLRHNTAHRWYYVSNMQPDEVLIFKGYDTQATGVARYTPHTGFAHPDRPAQFKPRESIEVRALVVYPAA